MSIMTSLLSNEYKGEFILDILNWLRIVFIPEKYDLLNFYTVFLRILFSVIIGGLIGFERGKHGRAAGMRTHILVCIGATMTSMTSLFVSDVLSHEGDVFRISAQVISGIGFLGAGMIIVKNSNMITGLTTAAGVWATGTIGVAIGYGFYTGALIAAITCIFTAAFLTRFERKRKMQINLYAEISNPKLAGKIFDDIHTKVSQDVLIEIVDSKSGIKGNLALFITFSNSGDYRNLREIIESMDGVAFVIPE